MTPRTSGAKTASILAAIESQMCPWCGAGPFIVLASHCARAHGVDPLVLRHMAGLTSGASVCSVEYSATCRERSLERGAEPPHTPESIARAQAARDRRDPSWRRAAAEAHQSRSPAERRRIALKGAAAIGDRASWKVAIRRAQLRPFPGVECSACGVWFTRMRRSNGGWIPDPRRSTCSEPCRAARRKASGEKGAAVRVGKKAAGRELDGRTWDECPA